MAKANRICLAGGHETAERLKRGMCQKHYRRWRKYGDPSGARPDPAPDLPGEQWLPVPYWEGCYDISNHGRARSLPRIVSDGREIPGCMLKAAADEHGYLYVNLWRNNEGQRRYIAHLVLEAFKGPRPAGHEARHGPGGRQDNRATELCWGTPAENAEDKVRDGTDNRGEKHWRTRLTAAEVGDIRHRIAAGETCVHIASEKKISHSEVSMIASGKRWQHDSSPVVPPRNPGERSRLNKLTVADVHEIRARHATGQDYGEIAESYGVTRQTVGRVIRGETWGHVA